MLLSIDMEVNTEILSKKKSKSCLWEEGNELREQGTTIFRNKTVRTICFKLQACITLTAKKEKKPEIFLVHCYQWCADKLLTTSSPKQKISGLICSICQFPWYKVSPYDQWYQWTLIWEETLRVSSPKQDGLAPAQHWYRNLSQVFHPFIKHLRTHSMLKNVVGNWRRKTT